MTTLQQIAGLLEYYREDNLTGDITIKIHNGMVTQLIERRSYFPVNTEVNELDNIGITP